MGLRASPQVQAPPRLEGEQLESSARRLAPVLICYATAHREESQRCSS